MTTQTQGTAEVNGRLWGAKARAWADIQEASARPLYLDVLALHAVGAGTAYLDVGCGAGLALQLAAERGANVTGLDASAALLDIARERVPAAELHVGELESLPFADDRFDVVTGFNSFQYAAQPLGALAQARRVAKPGGRVIIATWSPPDRTQAAAVLGALKPLLPPPPPGAPGPFALSDEAVLRKLASDAELTPGEVRDVDCPFVYPDVETGVRGLGSAGVAERAARHSGADAVDAAHRAVLEKFRRADGSVFIANAFRYLVATR
ncbi:MAG TPA: class I SAM-dependent methyltransferase [Polyangia bacterium]|nr:class I SAM-dependent methyltransferase [Polyangia bacterium]